VPVVNDPRKSSCVALVVNEMEKRYQIFAKVGVATSDHSTTGQGQALAEIEPELPLKAKKEKIEAGADGFAVEVDEEIVVRADDDIVIPEKLSYIVVIIDELADLNARRAADVEWPSPASRRMARAAGIHCIVATQRPSWTSSLAHQAKSLPVSPFRSRPKWTRAPSSTPWAPINCWARRHALPCRPARQTQSRPGRAHHRPEINAIVEFIQRQGKPSYEMEIHQQLSKPVSSFDGENGIDEDEDLIQQCIEVIRSEQKASVSLCSAGCASLHRAARIMDELENRGIVGPGKGAEPRDILIDLTGPVLTDKGNSP